MTSKGESFSSKKRRPVKSKCFTGRGRKCERTYDLFNLFYRVRTIFFKSDFTLQVIDLFQGRPQVLQHIVGLTAAGARGTDKYDRLVSRQGCHFLLQIVRGDVDGGFERAFLKLIRIPHIYEHDTARVFIDNLFKCRNVNGPLFGTGLDCSGLFDITGDLFPRGVSGREHAYVFIAKFYRLPGGLVTELSGVSLTVENQRRTFIGGQVALEFVKLAVGDADGARDVPLVVLGAFGA